MYQINSNHLSNSLFETHLCKTTGVTNFVSFSSLVDYMASSQRSSRLLVLRILVIFYSVYCLDAQQVAQKPHIIMIVADDLVRQKFSFKLTEVSALALKAY